MPQATFTPKAGFSALSKAPPKWLLHLLLRRFCLTSEISQTEWNRETTSRCLQSDSVLPLFEVHKRTRSS